LHGHSKLSQPCWRGRADPNIHDDEGATPLMRAVLATPPAAVEALLAAGANAQDRNRSGDTAADLVRRRLDWLPKQPGYSQGKKADG
jgi:ankyrin repeat protein